MVTTSISGDTAETLSVLDSAKKLGSKLIAFSSGGKMEKFCGNNDIRLERFHNSILYVHLFWDLCIRY